MIEEIGGWGIWFGIPKCIAFTHMDVINPVILMMRFISICVSEGA